MPPPPSELAAIESIVETEPYRVTIEVRDNAERDRVARLFKEAFPLTIGGRLYIQVGVFEDRDRARTLADSLQDRGFFTFIIQLEKPETSPTQPGR